MATLRPPFDALKDGENRIFVKSVVKVGTATVSQNDDFMLAAKIVVDIPLVFKYEGDARLELTDRDPRAPDGPARLTVNGQHHDGRYHRDGEAMNFDFPTLKAKFVAYKGWGGVYVEASTQAFPVPTIWIGP